jgi:PAS domain S-box-containing protein
MTLRGRNGTYDRLQPGGPEATERSRSNLSLRRRLLLLVLVSVVPLLSFSFALQLVQYRKEIAATGRQTLEIARGMSAQLEQQLQTYIDTLQVIASATSLQTGDLERFRERTIPFLKREFPGSDFLLVRQDGQYLINTHLPPGTPLHSRKNMETTRQVFASGRPVISNLFRAASDGRPIVSIDVPVIDADNRVIYVATLNPSLDDFTGIIRRQILASTWIASVYDNRGDNIARLPPSELPVGHKATPSVLGALTSHNEGFIETTTFEGLPYLTAFSHDARFGWSVAVGLPRSELTQPALTAALRTLSAGMAWLAFGLALALFAARRIAGPIDSLRRVVATIDSSSAPIPIITGLPEVDEVAQALFVAEQARRRNQRDQSVLLEGIENMPEGFAVYDNEDRLILCNESYRHLFPALPDQVVLGVKFEHMLREGIASEQFAGNAAAEEGWVADLLRDHRDPRGSFEQSLVGGRTILVNNRRLRNGWISGLRVDITLFKSAERALRESEEQLKRAQHLVHLGSFVTDLVTGHADLSDETYRLFGVTRESFGPAAENLFEYVHPDDRETVRRGRALAKQGICPEPMEFRIVRPDGEVRTLHNENELILDELRKPLYLTGTLQDVTERRQVEAQLRQAQKMEAIGNLTGGMAHDFNNLLGVIIGNLDYARTRIEEDSDLIDVIADARSAAWHGADLTRHLLAFARRQPLNPDRVDVNELITNTVRLLKRLIGENVSVSLVLTPETWPVVVDPAQLETSLANLATNARDAMPRGGRIIIATSNHHLDSEYVATHVDIQEGDYALIEVSDTGTGMSAETLSRVFEPFFTTKEAGKGSGLGLSMVFGFIRQSGGHITVYSELGAGTTFQLYLPRATGDVVAREPIRVSRVEQGGGETVLVVEDNPEMRSIVLRQLRDLGYQPVESDSAAQALDILHHEHVDLLFTDVVMPGGLDGGELARLVAERWPAIKIILTSGFPQERINSDSVELKHLRLLIKPYSREEMAAALRAAFDA